MNIIQTEFNNISVSFQNNGYLNATSIAKTFDKRVGDYLRLERTEDYIQALSQRLVEAGNPVSDKKQLVIVKKGGDPFEQGTWLHPKLAVDFARWLNPHFAVWCDEQIEKILHKPAVTNSQPSTVDSRKPLRAAVNILVSKSTLDYVDVYHMIHERFNVESLDELTESEVIEAIEYVHGLILKATTAMKEEKEAERISHKEMENLRRIVAQLISPFFFQESARWGIWKRLRNVTDTPSPALFRRKDLPIIVEELKRMIEIADAVYQFRGDIDAAIIRKIIREGQEQDKILANLRSEILQALEHYQEHQLTNTGLSLLQQLS